MTGLAASFQASACSRPPEPMRSTLISLTCRSALPSKLDCPFMSQKTGINALSTDWPFDLVTGELLNEPPRNAAEYSVSELSAALKRTLEESFGYVRVRGEIGRVTSPGSGHCYLDLKDDRAVISAVIWKTAFSRLRIKPEQGLEVIVTGKVTTFPGQSKYQIVIETIEPAGIGALMALLEDRKRRLMAEGLFDAARKKP